MRSTRTECCVWVLALGCLVATGGCNAATSATGSAPTGTGAVSFDPACPPDGGFNLWIGESEVRRPEPGQSYALASIVIRGNVLPDGARCPTPYTVPSGIAVIPTWFAPTLHDLDNMRSPVPFRAEWCIGLDPPFVDQVDALHSQARQPALPQDPARWTGYIEGHVTYRVEWNESCISGFSYYIDGEAVLADGRRVPIDEAHVMPWEVRVEGTNAYQHAETP